MLETTITDTSVCPSNESGIFQVIKAHRPPQNAQDPHNFQLKRMRIPSPTCYLDAKPCVLAGLDQALESLQGHTESTPPFVAQRLEFPARVIRMKAHPQILVVRIPLGLLGVGRILLTTRAGRAVGVS